VAALRLRSREFKELEIVVLRHELAVLRRQISRPRLDERDRVFLAAAGQLLGRGTKSFFVRPDTLLGWHRQLVRKRWTYAGRRPGRPAVPEEIRELVLRLARENPRWGYERIVGELAGVGVGVSATTVAKILRQAGVSPAGARAQLRWREFLRAHADSIIACDFFTVETLWLGRLYVLFFLELGSRRVRVAGCTANPDGSWTAQRARQLAWSLCERATPARFLIRDRDSKFTRAFDEVFRSEGVEIIRTPFRAPKANAFAERWVGTVRRDCLDWLLICSRRQLERVLRVYVDHYNTHRPHRALADSTDTTTSPTPRRSRPARPTPPTRPTRRTDPRIHPSSMTDEFAYPTRSAAPLREFRSGAGDRELKRRRWGCLLPRCLAA
jgi:putative transposase